MCELLGISSRKNININFSFNEFCCRGGGSGMHKDGWGIAFKNGDLFRLFLEDKPAFTSKVAEIVRGEYFKTDLVISHIRRATVGKVALKNTQPFSRILWDWQWIFAHNGDLPEFHKDFKKFNCLGDTDSEKVFCFILETLDQECSYQESDPFVLARKINEVADQLSDLGVLNFLLSNGKFLFAHGHSSLHYLKRAYPFSKSTLRDKLLGIDLSKLNDVDDKMLLVTTRPLTTDEDWVSLISKKVQVFYQGDILVY